MRGLATALHLKSPAERFIELRLEKVAPWSIGVYLDRARHAAQIYYEVAEHGDQAAPAHRLGCEFDEGDLIVDDPLIQRARDCVVQCFADIGLTAPTEIEIEERPAELMA